MRKTRNANHLRHIFHEFFSNITHFQELTIQTIRKEFHKKLNLESSEVMRSQIFLVRVNGDDEQETPLSGESLAVASFTLVPHLALISACFHMLQLTSLPYSISKSTTVLNRQTTYYYIVKKEEKELYNQVILIQSYRFLVLIFVFAGEQGILGCLLSLSLFSLFSHIWYSFTQLNTQIVRPFNVEFWDGFYLSNCFLCSLTPPAALLS